MTGGGDESGERDVERTRGEAARLTRRARVFGDVLPETTSDERADAWGDREGDTEDWLRRQVPPHHG